MLKGINGSGHVIVNNNYSSMPYVSPNSNNPATGMIRLNGNNMEVFDGSTWLQLSGSYPTVELDQIAQSSIQWAVKKMEEERKWKELAEKNKSVKIALEHLEQARQKLEITAHLAKEEYETTS